MRYLISKMNVVVKDQESTRPAICFTEEQWKTAKELIKVFGVREEAIIFLKWHFKMSHNDAELLYRGVVQDVSD